MQLNLTTPLRIKTGFVKVDLEKIGSKVSILSLTVRLSERSVLVEYRIEADDNSGRDHRNAVVVPLDSLDKDVVLKILKGTYNELKKLPGFDGEVINDKI